MFAAVCALPHIAPVPADRGTDRGDHDDAQSATLALPAMYGGVQTGLPPRGTLRATRRGFVRTGSVMFRRFCHPKLGVPGALLALTLGSAAGAAAAEPAAEAAAEPGSAPVATQEIVEATRRSVRATAEWLARGVDGWFGDKPFEDGGKVTDGRLSVAVFKRQGEQPDLDVRFSAHIRLPNIEHRAYLFVGRDDPRSAIRDKPDALSSQQRLLAARPEDRSFLAGLGLSLPNAVDVRLGVSARLKPYVQGRYTQLWAWEPGQSLDLRETVFWAQEDRFGSTTALAYEFDCSDTLALRWLSAATITQASRNFDWSSSFGAYQSMGSQRLLSFEALFYGTGAHGTGVGMSDFGLLAKWEQPLYKTWLTGEIAGGHFWPRPDAASPRGRAWALGGNLKMRF